MSEIRIGISGWRYKLWRGSFYPSDLSQKKELYYASRQLNTIEINGSFYSLQNPKLYRQWYDDTPEDFIFSVKGGRFITHMKQLRDIEQPLANFFASGVLELKNKLGPFLWQLPPRMPFREEVLESFFKLLPKTSSQALKLARLNDGRVKNVQLPQRIASKALRHCIEVRHPSFVDLRYIRLLRKYNIASVVSDAANLWPCIEDMTADFVYIRLHGEDELYKSGYDDAALKKWQKKMEAWRHGLIPSKSKLIDPDFVPVRAEKDLFVFFDNDIKVRAPFDAARLLQLMTDFEPRIKMSRNPQGKLNTPPAAELEREMRVRWPKNKSLAR